MPRLIAPKPLSKDLFALYGDVIETEGAEHRQINEGHTTRFHNLAQLNLIDANGQPSINIFRSSPRVPPLTLSLMERHPVSSQAFYPLSGEPYLIVVAPPGELHPEKIEVFLARADQGINYHAGTWHHYSLALNTTSDFLVVDRIADDENCDEVLLDEPDQVQIDLSGITIRTTI
ncbi:MAG: ureidoglycolate lyase [Candidatus Azotimanducaceae bacterium]